MRDPGLEEAIRDAGGVGALARKIGISQPSVSNWSRVPAERVLSVEAATGIHRAVLRPDLYGPQDAGQREADDAIDEVDGARAQEYALLAILLARAPSADLLARLTTLRGDASPLGLAHVALADGGGQRMPSGSSGSSSTCSSASAAANFCRTAPTISPASSTSARWRGCVPTCRGSASSAPQAIPSRKTMPPCCATSWRGSPADASRRRRAPTVTFSKNISRPGSAASLPIWKRHAGRISIAGSEPLGRLFMLIESEAFTLAA